MSGLLKSHFGGRDRFQVGGIAKTEVWGWDESGTDQGPDVVRVRSRCSNS